MKTFTKNIMKVSVILRLELLLVFQYIHNYTCSYTWLCDILKYVHYVLPYSSQDKSADFSSSSSVGQKNKLLAKTVMGLYEVEHT